MSNLKILTREDYAKAIVKTINESKIVKEMIEQEPTSMLLAIALYAELEKSIFEEEKVDEGSAN